MDKDTGEDMGDGIKPVGDAPFAGNGLGTPATADPADVHAMRAAMSETPTAPSLSSLFSSQGAVAEEAVQAADRDAPDKDPRDGEPSDEDVAAEVAERVLVTDKEYSDDEEVRIYLKNSVLVDTEVHLRRVSWGLEVRVQTGDRGSYAILCGAKDALARRLEGCCDGQVRLDIVLMGPEE